jgi:hypothetical protein
VTVNPAVEAADRELARVRAHQAVVRRVLRAEQAIHGKVRTRTRTKADPVAEYERILAVLAEAFPAGSVVTGRMVVEAVGCSVGVAYLTKCHALAGGRWPYVNGQAYGGPAAIAGRVQRSRIRQEPSTRR